MIGAVLASLLVIWRYRMPLLATADAHGPSVALGLAIGRLGCFFNGCCYGDPCDLPWAVQFPAGSSPWWHQAVGPDGSQPTH